MSDEITFPEEFLRAAPSERAAILAADYRHSDGFIIGISESEKDISYRKKYGEKYPPLSAQSERERLAEKYGVRESRVYKYIRIHRCLVPALKERLDREEYAFETAFMLACLTADHQHIVNEVLGGTRLGMRHSAAAKIRAAEKGDEFSEDAVRKSIEERD